MLRLGSLFSGSGGFELGACLAGISPRWASEIEPFPIMVTSKRFPELKHLGNIQNINGGEIEPVDIITGGSPCQDLSVAGKRAGLIKGERSNLFFEYMRIVREMREATNGKYPRFIVWENVFGAFSSNGGEDFKAVLDSIIKIKDPKAAEVPLPKDGRWPYADILVGDGWSIAYRTLDAQYWGVPQRRRRIYLVADFGGRCAGKILFESEGLSGNSQTCGSTGKGTATGTEKSIGETGNGMICLNDQGGQFMDVTNDMTGTLRAQSNHPPLVFENRMSAARYSGPLKTVQTIEAKWGTGGNNQGLVAEPPRTLKIRSGCAGGGKGALVQENKSATLGCNNDQTLFVSKAYGISSYDSNAMKSDNPTAGIYEAETARTLDVSGGNPSCNQGGIAVVEGNECRPSHLGDGYKESDTMYTLNTVDHHAVAYGLDRASFNQGKNARFDFSIEKEKEPPLLSRGPGAVAVGNFYPQMKAESQCYREDGTCNTLVNGTNPGHQNAVTYAMTSGCFIHTEKEKSPTLAARDYKDPNVVNDSLDNEYIVRRLTPKECARLQGFPDWWCSGLGTENPTRDEIEKWRSIFMEYNRIMGKSVKPKSDNQIIKWLKNPHSDSAEYKMWGNGVALPCVRLVMNGIAHYCSD